MKFFVLDDQPERCEGLKTLLRQIDRQAKFTEAQSWQQVMHILRFGLPDLLVIDGQSRWMDVANLMNVLREYPTLRVAILSEVTDSEMVDSLLHAGVLGVIPRHLDPRLILRALELVSLGGHYVPVCALNSTLSDESRPTKNRTYSPDKKFSRRPNSGMERLSPRQHQIMRLVHMGNTNKMIARALGISEGTVKIHLASVFRILGATNRASAVALYNNWQFEKLRIWCSRAEGMGPKPIPGMRSPVPLRPRKNSVLPRPATDAVLMLAAAQVTSTYRVLSNTPALTKLPADGT